MRSARVPLLYPCRYAREKLSVRENVRRCPPLAFCPKRISVGRAQHHRKRTHSIRRFRTKLTFRRNILRVLLTITTALYPGSVDHVIYKIMLNIIPTLYEGYTVSVRRMVMKKRPVDPGSIQGSHRPIPFTRIKHRTRAKDFFFCKTEY